MKIRYLKIRINTGHKTYGTDIPFPTKGLTILRADNTAGKSTCIKAMLMAACPRKLFARDRGVCAAASVPEAVLVDTHVPDTEQVHGEVFPQPGAGG